MVAANRSLPGTLAGRRHRRPVVGPDRDLAPERIRTLYPRDARCPSPSRPHPFGSSEYAALDLATVVLKGVVQVYRGCLGGCLRLSIPDGAVDRLMLLDRGGGVTA